MMGSLVLFAIFIMIYIIIIEIFTVLFRLTGMTREKARTQVISLLTNSGFTTEESEIVLSSPRRRRLAQITMLFGYSFSVIIVSLLVNFFLELSLIEIKGMIWRVAILFFAVLIFFLLARLKVVYTWFDHLIEKLGNRLMFGKKSNAMMQINSYSDKAIVEIMLANIPAFLYGVALAQTHLKEEYGIHILFIKRGGIGIEKISGETVLMAKDTLLVFGNYKNIKKVFEHPDDAR